MSIENSNITEYKVKSGDSLTKIVVLKYGKELGFPMDAVKGDKINWKSQSVKDFLKDSNVSSSFWDKVNELYMQTKDYATRLKKGEATKITYETWTGFDTPKSKLKKEKNRFSLLTGEKLKLEQLRNELDPNSYINEALPVSKVESPLEKIEKSEREKVIGTTQNTIENGNSDERKEAVDIALKIPTGVEAEKLSSDKKLAIEELEKGLYGSEVENPEDDIIKSMIKEQKIGVDSLAFGVDWEGIDAGNGEDDATIIIKANNDLKYNLSIKNENSYKFDPISQKFVKVGEKETKEYQTNSNGKGGILEIRSYILINRILHQMYRNHEVENNLIKDQSKLYSKLINCDEKKLRTIANWRDNQDYGKSENFSRFHSNFGSDVPTEILLDTYETINKLETIKDKDGNQKYIVQNIIWEKGKDDIFLSIKNNTTGDKKEIKFDKNQNIEKYII